MENGRNANDRQIKAPHLLAHCLSRLSRDDGFYRIPEFGGRHGLQRGYVRGNVQRKFSERRLRQIKFVDMFCGMGTVRMGFEKAGHECVYSIEWDKYKRQIYEVIFGHGPDASDIRAVSGSDIPVSDCWCFGAPCQDFSIAGRRIGMDGDRSSLVREVFRLVRETPEEHRPEWLLYENVKGMLSSNKGLDYLEILFEMASLGYDIQYELLNSKDFGVPQNRERVYTLGHLRTRGERKVFPISKYCRQLFEEPARLRKQKTP